MLTVEEVREYITDYPDVNLLLDKEEFSDSFITLCMGFGVESFNSISPRTRYTESNFPGKEVHLLGTLYHMYNGRAAQMARNNLSYTDGGLQIPVEEKYELYSRLAANFQAQFLEVAGKLKITINMEQGWGEIRSDQAMIPLW